MRLDCSVHRAERSSAACLSMLVGLAAVLCTLAACAPSDTPELTLAQRDTPTPQIVVEVVSSSPTPTVAAATGVAPTPPHELGAGQHIAGSGSYSDSETDAAGPMACRIERGSPAFYQLIGNYDPRVLWSEAEPPPFNDEDHLMHAAMLEPFKRLVSLAQQEWGGETQIMVTEAYDSLGDHDPFHTDQKEKYALHFEGRSIDMIPWPPESKRLARMCALAHLAGFDWVHNEADHCHASVKAQSLCELYDYRFSP